MHRVVTALRVAFCLIFILLDHVLVNGQPVSQNGSEIQREAEQLRDQQLYKKALIRFEQAASQYEKERDWKGAIDALIKAARIGYSLSDGEIVRSHINSALRLSKATGVNDQSRLGDCHYILGQYFFFYRKLPDSARMEYDTSLHLREKIGATLATAESLMGLGNVERYFRFDYAQAEPFYERALQILLARHKEDFSLTSLYYSLSTTYHYKGDLGKALSYCLEANRLADVTNDLEHKEKCLVVLANLYADLGQYSLAEENFRLAIEISQKLQAGQSHHLDMVRDQAIGFGNLGYIFQEQHQHRRALQNLDRAYRIFQSIGEERSANAADILVRTAKSYAATGDDRQAVATFHQAIAIYKVQNNMDHRGASEVFLDIAKFYQQIHVSDSALWYYHQAMMTPLLNKTPLPVLETPSADAIGYRYYLFEAVMSKAQLLLEEFRLGKRQDPILLKAALKHFQLAEELFQHFRNSYDFESSKKRISNQYHWLYESFMETAFLLHEQGFAWADTIGIHIQEKSKAKQLQEILLETAAAHSLGLPDTILFSQHTITARQAYFYEKLAVELAKSLPDTVVAERYRTNLVRLTREAAQLESTIKKQYPSFYAVKFERSTIGVKQLMTRARNDGTLFLEYFWGENDVFVNVIGPGSVSFKKVGKAEIVGAKIRTLLSNIRDTVGSVGSLRRFSDFKRDASDLYQLLVKPFIPVATKSIVVVPDGMLYQLPFECLLTDSSNSDEVNYRELPYLIRKTTTSYSYSLASYLNPMELKEVGTPNLLAFAYSGNENKGVAVRSSRSNDLPGSEIELIALRNIFSRGEFFSGPDATESNFKHSAGKFDVLHLAIHGFASENPMNARLVFRPSLDSVDDGQLFVYEIYAMKLSAGLAVLSACETGVGKFFKGEGIASLASAFAYAGCPQVVMSLWKADDLHTAKLMSKFYKFSSDGMNINDALMRAKQEYVLEANELTAHPSLWASFVLMGNGRPIVGHRSTSMAIWLGILVFGMIAAYFLIRRRT